MNKYYLWLDGNKEVIKWLGLSYVVILDLEFSDYIYIA